MSGHASEAIFENGVLKPRVALLQKPFAPGALESKVREVLEGRVSSRP